MEWTRKHRTGLLLAGLLGLLGLVWWSRPRQKRSNLQLADDGHGPLIYRSYWLDIQNARIPAGQLFKEITEDVPQFCPSLLADFRKTRGSEAFLKVGDEYDIRIFGPWNGRVRVVEIDETSFTLATLKPHPEAGQIRFELETLENNLLRFSISSQARSRDSLVHLAYRFLGGNKVQEKAWQTFCERVAEESGGEAAGEFQTETRELAETRNLEVS
ncbi:DUF1990 family protein [Deinococcus cellulosilyticus]|uniref:DUF1990 domain-containing protein n=1 Tax=Deinococcus cellulosilyticus (strain DSM 18568 / NBRC 106333 / KACC 11606 / 5516J-15) TaxID=1223518 RepID=A0A511N5B6_DEIC1|nr:DUF1990 family protein [Deinococcus cellulosilyticus]GEM48049.1 hypothetical protein DC3_36840 [Deinococcus cellulosilyticus NBRC 106333 = KACC 11606]